MHYAHEPYEENRKFCTGLCIVHDLTQRASSRFRRSFLIEKNPGFLLSTRPRAENRPVLPIGADLDNTGCCAIDASSSQRIRLGLTPRRWKNQEAGASGRGWEQLPSAPFDGALDTQHKP